MDDQKLLKLNKISKSYISENKVIPVLSGIDLAFGTGEFVAITGNSGCGKTTLLNIIARIIPEDSGNIYFHNKKISEYSIAMQENYVKNKIAYITQDNRLIFHYSALKNIMCAAMLQGYSRTDAKLKAVSLLETVGLSEYADRKAYKLSAGQRQRLVIAQILAKDSEILLADEPTANLDSENGDQIMQLLKKISADHLVIMVTHNIAQAEPYISRKITIYSGSVESDVVIKKIEPPVTVSEPVRNNNTKDNTGCFVRWNLTSRMGRSITVSTICLVMAIVFIVFFGLIFANADNIYTKKYCNKAFANMSDKRIIVCRQDGMDMTDEDISRLRDLQFVEDVEQYDCVNDISYYMTKDRDYRYIYDEDYRMTVFIKNDNYMRSCTGLTENDVTSGRLPEDIYEVAVSSGDTSLIGKQLIVYLYLPFVPYGDAHFAKLFTITGTVQGNSKQAYFSEPFCQMITALYEGCDNVIYYTWDDLNNKYLNRTDFIPMIDDSLKGDKVTITDSFAMSMMYVPHGLCHIVSTSYESVYGLSEKIVHEADVDCSSYEYSDLEFELGEYMNTYNDSDYPYMNVSEELFYRLYTKNNKQVGLFIKDYVYTDKVLNQIQDLGGYSASSTFRMSMIDSDPIKAGNRHKILDISVVMLIAGSAIGIILISRFMGLNKKDYFVMYTLGMDRKHLIKMVTIEQSLMAASALIIVVLGLAFLWYVENQRVFSFLKYFFAKQYAICLIFYMAFVIVSNIFFVKRLNKDLIR